MRHLTILGAQGEFDRVKVFGESYTTDLSPGLGGHWFGETAANPGALHSVTTLSETAGLSRSAFMARFAGAVGCSPMAALRQLRMRQASNLMTANVLSIEQIAHAVGYASRSSFSRVFRRAFGSDPAEYRAQAMLSAVNYTGAGRGSAR